MKSASTVTVQSRRDRRRAEVVLGVVAIAMGAAIAVVIALIAFQRPAATFEGKDMKGNTVALDPGSGLTPAVVKDMRATTDTGARFKVPSVGLNVPLGSLDMVDNTITPPGFTSAYEVRNLGVTPARASDGTVFVAMHSLRDGAIGPGNYLIDVEHRRARVAVGATIDVAGVRYKVTRTQAIAKTAIGSDWAIWSNVRNRLVVITCLQRPQGGPSLQNMVIIGIRTT